MAIVHGYATREQLDAHLGDSRGKDGDLKDRAIEASSRLLESWTNRRFWLDVDDDGEPVSSTRMFRGCTSPLFVDDFTTLVSVTPETSFRVLGSPYATTSYRPGPLNAPVAGEPYNWVEGFLGWYGVLHVEAVWGWPSVPAAITQACLLLASRLYKRKDTTTATLGFDEFAVRLSSIDPDVENLIDAYRWIVCA